jgi:hypothetical protein
VAGDYSLGVVFTSGNAALPTEHHENWATQLVQCGVTNNDERQREAPYPGGWQVIRSSAFHFATKIYHFTTAFA